MRPPIPVVFLAAAALFSCAAPAPMPTVPKVDLERFMGDWYVIAHIPASIEEDAYDALESYRLEPDGTITTTYTFSDGGFDGPAKSYHPNGIVRNTATNAEWGMQFIWPFRSEYLIVYLDDDYAQTIIGRTDRDYVWIMARAPKISPADYERLVAKVLELGYDTAKLRLVPQGN